MLHTCVCWGVVTWRQVGDAVVVDGLSQLSCVDFAGFAIPMLVVLDQRPMCHISSGDGSRVEHWVSHLNFDIAAEVLCQLSCAGLLSMAVPVLVVVGQTPCVAAIVVGAVSMGCVGS